MVAGGHAWLKGGMHGCGGVHGCQGAVHGCRGGICGYRGLCMVAEGGMHGCRGGCVVVKKETFVVIKNRSHNRIV